MKALFISLLAIFFNSSIANAAVPCAEAGPQTPRDISNKSGTNTKTFDVAPDYKDLNLCNIHLHKSAEHKGPDFSIEVNKGENIGYACNETSSLTKEQLKDPTNGEGAFKGVEPGDTIEVHWVHSSCDIEPGKGLGACLNDECKDPKFRVETQVFVLVNDEYALDFSDYTLAKEKQNGFYQAKSIPTGTGNPVVFHGSTTGPSYDDKTCSPLNVTWSVKPQCAKLDISSLHEWAEKGNVFEETEAHKSRKLVIKPELLAPIK
jgi:hypothetical protein